jgi:predicted glutamine amidotransferase
VTDPAFSASAAAGSDLVLLHARRAPEGWPVTLTSTHPFAARSRGRFWVFCHNGIIRDVTPLEPAEGLAPEGSTDSERLFHHLLARFDPSAPEASLLSALAPVRDYSSLHFFMATQDVLLAVSQRHPDDPFPEHHALWEGRGPGLRVVSSEPVDDVGCDEWRPMRVPEVLIIERDAR